MLFEISATRTMEYRLPVEADSLSGAKDKAERLIRGGIAKSFSDECFCRQDEKFSAAEYAACHWDDVLDLLPGMLREALDEAEVDVEGDCVVLSFGSMFAAKYAENEKSAIEDAASEIAEKSVSVDIRVPFPGSCERMRSCDDGGCRGRCAKEDSARSLFDDIYRSTAQNRISFEYRPQSCEMRFCDKDNPSAGCSVFIIGAQGADPASAAFEGAALEAILRAAEQFDMLLKAFPPALSDDDASFARRFLPVADFVSLRSCGDNPCEDDDW